MGTTRRLRHCDNMSDRKLDQEFRKKLRGSIANYRNNSMSDDMFRLYASQIFSDYLTEKVENHLEDSLSKVFE
jgi:hypothetical protein